MIEWIEEHWWIILVILVGFVINGIKELRRLDHRAFLANKPEVPPHKDNNAQWDDDDEWPKQKPPR